MQVIACPHTGIVIERFVFAHLYVVIGDDLVKLEEQIHQWCSRLHVAGANERRADIRMPDFGRRAPAEHTRSVELAQVRIGESDPDQEVVMFDNLPFAAYETGAIEASQVRAARRGIKRLEIQQVTCGGECHAFFTLAIEKIHWNTVVVCHLPASNFEMGLARDVLDTEHVTLPQAQGI